MAFAQAARLRPGPPGRTNHTIGLPIELGGTPMPMQDPTFVVISPAEQGWMLERFTESLATAGDTWHETPEDARGQAAWEYGNRLGEWIELAPDTDDLAAVLAQVGDVTFTDAD